MSHETKRCPKCLTPGAPCGSDDAAMAESACAELAADYEYRRAMKAEIEMSELRHALATALQRATDAESARVRAEAERDSLRASRVAYASEFAPNADGDPDVGSVHENIRALKADLAAARARAERIEREMDDLLTVFKLAERQAAVFILATEGALSAEQDAGADPYGDACAATERAAVALHDKLAALSPAPVDADVRLTANR